LRGWRSSVASVLASCFNLQFSPAFNITILHTLFSLTTNLQLVNKSEKLGDKTKHGINIIPKEIPKLFQ
jgi:hypothetical protein